MSARNKRNASLALGMLLLVVVLGAYTIGLFEPVGADAEPENSLGEVSADGAQDFPGIDPTDVVQRFYDDWLDYGRFTGNPLFAEYYRESGYLTDAGIARLEAEKGPEGWLADPVLCAQDLPESVTVESATVDGDLASVLAVTSWDTRLGLDLVKVDREWLIDSITCLGR